jgi:hypothetical protein
MGVDYFALLVSYKVGLNCFNPSKTESKDSILVLKNRDNREQSPNFHTNTHLTQYRLGFYDFSHTSSRVFLKSVDSIRPFLFVIWRVLSGFPILILSEVTPAQLASDRAVSLNRRFTLANVEWDGMSSMEAMSS